MTKSPSYLKLLHLDTCVSPYIESLLIALFIAPYLIAISLSAGLCC